MEPDGYQPNDVEYDEYGIRERLLNPTKTVCRTDGWHSTDDLCKHHVVPEVPEVNEQTDADNDTQHQHVLRCPLYLTRVDRCCHLVTVIATTVR